MVCSECWEKGPPGSFPQGLWSHRRPEPKPRPVSPNQCPKTAAWSTLCSAPRLSSGFWGQKGTEEGLRSWGKTRLQVRERMRTWSRWRNGKIGQAANTKGYSLSAVTCMALGRSGLHVPEGIGGD